MDLLQTGLNTIKLKLQEGKTIEVSYFIIEKLNVVHSNVDVTFSKNILKELFNGLIIKKKMMLSFMTVAFYGRSLFFVSDVLELSLNSSNCEMYSPFKFNYVLYSR